MNKQQRYYNAREKFLKAVRTGNNICYDEYLEEYKSASDDYYQDRFTAHNKCYMHQKGGSTHKNGN